MTKRNIIILCVVCLVTLAIGIALICTLSCRSGKDDPNQSFPVNAKPEDKENEPIEGNDVVPTDPEKEPNAQQTLPPETDAQEETESAEPTEDPLEIEIPDTTGEPDKATATPYSKETSKPTSTPKPGETDEPTATPDDNPIELPELP